MGTDSGQWILSNRLTMKNLLKLMFFICCIILFVGSVNAIKWDNVAYWSLEDNSNHIKDMTNNGYDGNVFGNPILGAEGKIEKSINFNYDGSQDNYLNISDIDLNQSVTYSLWVFQKEGDHDVTYLSKRDRWGGTTIEITSAKKIFFCVRTVSEKSKKGWTPLKQSPTAWIPALQV